MSGGSLSYFYAPLREHVGDFGDRELDDLVKDLAELFHEREWYLSGDTGVGSWNEARDEFKKKWFSEGARADRVNKYLEDIKDGVMQSFGLFKKYCKNCAHWNKENDSESYGKCAFEEHCLVHRCESCDKFQGKDVGE